MISVVFRNIFGETKAAQGTCQEPIVAALTEGECVNTQAILVGDISDVESPDLSDPLGQEWEKEYAIFGASTEIYF